jgi:hypothetical protein
MGREILDFAKCLFSPDPLYALPDTFFAGEKTFHHTFFSSVVRAGLEVGLVAFFSALRALMSSMVTGT